MVFGFSIAVTAVPSVYQCAETHRIALGLGIDSPSFRQVSVYLLRSSVFIGLPCPKNTTGILEWAFVICGVMPGGTAAIRRLRPFQAWFGAFWSVSPRR